ncbi:MAG TPA: AbrB/MazE/SpoVT family DNA-binding domain-containing protein [Clostridiaceae bacterium]|nr:AbrB/MazE/SpoVT family DNA-binding domain-containing protein [Clostridiaceae bacterium]
MNYDVKITSKGQITLPKEIREQLMLKFGDYLQAQVKDGVIVLKPKPKNNDNAVLMEYVEKYAAKSEGVKKVRELTSGMNLNMTEYVRKMREENK